MKKLTKAEKISIAIAAIVYVVAILLIYIFPSTFWSGIGFISDVNFTTFVIMSVFVMNGSRIESTKLYTRLYNFFKKSCKKSILSAILSAILWILVYSVLYIGLYIIFLLWFDYSIVTLIIYTILQYAILLLLLLTVDPALQSIKERIKEKIYKKDKEE